MKADPFTSDRRRRTGRWSQWYWMATLLAVLILVLIWFADPFAVSEVRPGPRPTANPTDWTVEPTGPAAQVNLPTTPMRNSAAVPTDAAPAREDGATKQSSPDR